MLAALAVACASALLSGVCTALTLSERHPGLDLELSVAGMFLASAVLALRFRGPGVARALALAFIPNLLWLTPAAAGAANELLLGMGEWCGTGRLQEAQMSGLVAAAVSGLVAFGLMVWRRSPSEPRMPRTAPALVAALALLALALVSLVRSARLPTTSELGKSLLPFVELEVPGELRDAAGSSLHHGEGLTVKLDCTATGSNRSRDCALLFSLDDQLGPEAPRNLYVHGGETIVVLSDPARRVFEVELTEPGATHPRSGGGFARDRAGSVGNLYAYDVREWVSARWTTAVLAILAATSLLAAASHARGQRARIRAILAARQGFLSADGQLVIDEQRHRVEAMTELRPGPVVVLQPATTASYRGASTIDGSSLLSGAAHDLAREISLESAAWASAVWVTAALLALPLLGASLVGLVV